MLARNFNNPETLSQNGWGDLSCGEIEAMLRKQGWSEMQRKGTEAKEGRVILESPDGSMVFRLKAGDIAYEQHIQTCLENADNPHFQNIYAQGYLGTGEHYCFMECLESLEGIEGLRKHQVVLSYLLQNEWVRVPQDIPEKIEEGMHSSSTWNTAISRIEDTRHQLNLDFPEGVALTDLKRNNLAQRRNGDGSTSIVFLDPVGLRHDKEKMKSVWGYKKYNRRVNRCLYFNPDVVQESALAA